MSLRELRTSRGLTQEQVARKADITLTTYGNYERNQTTPRLDIAKKLSLALNVSIDEIIEAVKIRQI